MANVLYTLTNNSDGEKSGSNTILIRLFGGNLFDEDVNFRHMVRFEENLLFFKHGDMGLGPKFLGEFPHGRLKEYIPSHTLTNEDLQDRKIRDEVAKKIARFHCLDMAVMKELINIFIAITNRNQGFKSFSDEFFSADSKLRELGVDLDFFGT